MKKKKKKREKKKGSETTEPAESGHPVVENLGTGRSEKGKKSWEEEENPSVTSIKGILRSQESKNRDVAKAA